MSTRLFVGNLPFSTTKDDLQGLFAPHGNVLEVEMVMDKFTARSRGFAFVTMETKEAAEAAIKALHHKELDGRPLTVNEARPREERQRAPSAPRDADRGQGSR